MKKLITAFTFLLFLGINIRAQNQRFAYEYKFISDSTAKNDIKTEIMYLDVTKKGSKFYSSEKIISDSIREDRIKRGIHDFTGINFGYVPYIVEKSYPDYKTIFFNSVDMDRYKVTDDRAQNWKILPDKQKIGEFDTQKATLDFAGRKWTAWFVSEIPVQDGPYKFHGLPGLIVKIEDHTNSHSFALKGIKKLDNDWTTESETKSFSNFIPVNVKTYKKQFIESRNNPSKGIRQMLSSGKKVVMMDESGKPMDIETMLKRNEKESKEANAKNNNLLELDLLK